MTRFGRKRPFDKDTDSESRRACNFMIQSSNVMDWPDEQVLSLKGGDRMSMFQGERFVKIIDTKMAHQYNNWYADCVGEEFRVIIYDSKSDEYTVSSEGKYHRLPGVDIELNGGLK